MWVKNPKGVLTTIPDEWWDIPGKTKKGLRYEGYIKAEPPKEEKPNGKEKGKKEKG